VKENGHMADNSYGTLCVSAPTGPRGGVEIVPGDSAPFLGSEILVGRKAWN